MKKFFLFAAAAIAALSVNAKTITFTGIVDKTDAETAKSSFVAAFNLQNLSVVGKPNSTETAYYAELTQVNGTEEWGNTTAKLKSDAQVYFDFKDATANKVVMKYWADYAQPNGKAVALVITGLKANDEVTINFKEALGKTVVLAGATVESIDLDDVAITLTATGSEIRMFSKTPDNGDAKWKLTSVEVPDGGQGIDNTNAAVKVEKFYRDGQLIIRKNGVEYNALGVKL